MIHREMLSLVNSSLLTVLMQRFQNLLKTATYNFKINFLDVQNLKKFKLAFWAEKFTNIVLEYTKRCGIATFGGYVF